MTLPNWALKIAAATTLMAIVGIGAAMSAPSFLSAQDDVVLDDSYQPGEFGVDYAAVTGPVGSQPTRDGTDMCRSSARPNIPAECLGNEDAASGREIRLAP